MARYLRLNQQTCGRESQQPRQKDSNGITPATFCSQPYRVLVSSGGALPDGFVDVTPSVLCVHPFGRSRQKLIEVQPQSRARFG